MNRNGPNWHPSYISAARPAGAGEARTGAAIAARNRAALELSQILDRPFVPMDRAGNLKPTKEETA